MINLETERILSLSDATKVIPCMDGKRVHPSTIWRWCRKGLQGESLEYIRVGRRICTSEQALNRFFNNLAEQDKKTLSHQNNNRSEVISKNREREIEEAEKYLKSEGF